MTRLRFLCVAAAGPLCLSQEKKVAEPPGPRVQFWSGVVKEVSPDQVVVLRKLANRNPEERRFVITQETKVEGELSPDTRVVVGYVLADNTAVARRIVIRHRPR